MQTNAKEKTKSTTASQVSHKDLANSIRALSMDAVQKANSGHPGMPMGMADVATVLFSEFLKFDPANPMWPDRDRFVLSAGHGSMLLYSLLYLTGYPDMTIEQIKQFRQLGSKTAGHPEYGYAMGVETTTGPLGQGLANAVGMALAEQIMAANYGSEITDHYTYTIAGDGCLMEGISHEAISLAGHLQLGKLIVLFDDNSISIDGGTDLSVSDDQLARFTASKWDVQAIDGHDPEAIRAAIAKAKESDTPSLIACKTTIAYGAPTKAGTSGSHGAPLGDEEIAGARKQLGWDAAPFEVPEPILTAWRTIGERGHADFTDWLARYNKIDKSKKAEYDRRMNGELPKIFAEKVEQYKEELIETQPALATRAASGKVLEVLTEFIPELLGGSADLTGSNLTKTSHSVPISKEDFNGNYVYYGVREHGMAAAMNGIALHQGLIPYGGTFMVFTDYCKPSIRLSALMKQRVIYVMTHDSIGLGEDGPTHQPVEHLAALRAVPNLQVFRPADAVETLECWQLALESKETPSVLVLTRQKVPALRKTQDEPGVNRCADGAYVISPAEDIPEVSLLASGSEVSIAVEVQKLLKEKNMDSEVISVASTELLDKNTPQYKEELVSNYSRLTVGIEAASGFGWERYIGRNGLFIGLNSFGESAPADDLYDYFGITAEKIVAKIMAAL